MRQLDGALGIHHAEAVGLVRDLASSSNARGVHEPVGVAIDLENRVDRIAGRAGNFAYNRALLTGQAVERDDLPTLGRPVMATRTRRTRQPHQARERALLSRP